MNIWKEKKIHIAKGGYGSNPLCSSSSNSRSEVRVAHGSIPSGVTCERCIRMFKKCEKK